MCDLDLILSRLFVALETRNIARAGVNGNIVGSAISDRLAQLKDVVDIMLLSRRRPGVQPTAAGEILLELERAMLTLINGLR